MTRRLLPLTFAALLSLSLAACGGARTQSCNFDNFKQCQTTTLTSPLVITSTCASPSVEVSSCPTAGVLGTCTLTSSITVSGTTGTSTVVTNTYAGGVDVATVQSGCTTGGGTWTTP